MKRIFLLLALLFAAGTAMGQSAYNYQRRSLFDQLPIRSNHIVFLGNSITDGGEWTELFDNRHIKNRGISGDRARWMVDRIDSIVVGHPKRLFLMIGINDLADGSSPEEIAGHVRTIIERFRTESRWTKLFVQSILPVNSTEFEGPDREAYAPQIIRTNELLQALCEEFDCTYIDLWPVLGDEKGRLDRRYTNDGLHLMGEGYLRWRDAIKPYVK